MSSDEEVLRQHRRLRMIRTRKFPVTFAILAAVIIVAVVIPVIIYLSTGGANDGNTGIDISQCTICPTPPSGLEGIFGQLGPTGVKGVDGDCIFVNEPPPGPDGYDCYDIDRDGFCTTIDDYDSFGECTVEKYCKGRRGERGDQGTNGTDGLNGTCDNSNICESGEKGIDGDRGTPGQRCWDSIGILSCFDTDCIANCTCNLYDVGCTCAQSCQCGVGDNTNFTTCTNAQLEQCPDQPILFNTDLFCNPIVDINGDLVCDVFDCRGLKGISGMDAFNSTITGNETDIVIAGTVEFNDFVNVNISSFLGLPFLNFSSLVIDNLTLVDFTAPLYNFYTYGTESYIFRGPSTIDTLAITNGSIMCTTPIFNYDDECMDACPDWSGCLADNLEAVRFRQLVINDASLFIGLASVPVSYDREFILGNDTYQLDSTRINVDSWYLKEIMYGTYFHSKSQLDFVSRDLMEITSRDEVIIESDSILHLISNDNPEPITVINQALGKQTGGLDELADEFLYSRIIMDGDFEAPFIALVGPIGFVFKAFGNLGIVSMFTNTITSDFSAVNNMNVAANTTVMDADVLIDLDVDVIQSYSGGDIYITDITALPGGYLGEVTQISDQTGGTSMITIGQYSPSPSISAFSADITMDSGKTISNPTPFTDVTFDDIIGITGTATFNMDLTLLLSDLFVIGDMTVSTGPCLVCPSDRRLKEKISDIDGSQCLDWIRAMQPKSYKKKFFRTEGTEDDRFEFFIAQELIDAGLEMAISKKKLPKQLLPIVVDFDHIYTVEPYALITIAQCAERVNHERMIALEEKLRRYQDIISKRGHDAALYGHMEL